MDKCPITGMPCPMHKCIHITDLNNNYEVKEKKDLCLSCGLPFIEEPLSVLQPKKKKLKNATPSQFLEFLKLFNKSLSTEPLVPVSSKLKTCSSCGCTIEDIANTAKLGCGECYEVFKKELIPLLEKAQHSLKHEGKKPKPKESLETRLKKAIESEDYEEAAKLRDEIRKLDSE